MSERWRFPADVPGWLEPVEGAALANLARDRIVLEIGSYHGRSTICMAQMAEHICALDWGKGDEGAGFEPSTESLRANLERYGVDDRVLVCPYRTEEFGHKFDSEHFDLVFVDGAHDEPSVTADLELARRVVKPGGVIALHDCDYQTVRSAARKVLGWEVGLNGTTGGQTVHRTYYRPYHPGEVDTEASSSEQRVFLGLPRRPGEKPQDEKDDEVTLIRPVSRGSFRVGRVKSSLLNYAFNKLWAAMLNCRSQGFTHNAMQHSDVFPDKPGWADTLIDEADARGADVCAAIIPIKDGRGSTTTGIRNAYSGQIRRLTMTEVMNLPDTFDLYDLHAAGIYSDGPPEGELLAVNTGLWICRIGSWMDKFPGFWSRDIVKQDEKGIWHAAVLSEDWTFSEWLWRNGLKAIATRKVALAHRDDNGKDHRNDHVWGEWETERGDAK